MVGKTLEILLIWVGCLSVSSARADLERASILPQGVRQPTVTYGVISGLGENFNSDGLIDSVGNKYHFQLAGPELAQFDGRLRQLISTLNAISPSSALGNELSVGTINFKANPVVTYVAPTFGYGLGRNISVGFGVPIIRTQNETSIVAGGVNNAAAIKALVGPLSAEADQALAQLATLDVPAAVQGVLASRGYKPVRNIDETRLGDMIVSAVYRYHDRGPWVLAMRPFVQIPTGTKDDPDDLVDVATGGQPAVGLYSIHEFRLVRGISLLSSLGYQANIEDRTRARVPINESDILPTQDRNDEVNRKTGNTTFVEAGTHFKISQPCEFNIYYDISFKDPDWYTGSRPGYNYGLLSRNTTAQAQTVKGEFVFSTTDWYTEKEFSIPFKLGLVYGQTIAGMNTPRATFTTVTLRMYF